MARRRMLASAAECARSVYAKKRLIAGIYISFFGMGVLWHALQATYAIMLAITPYVLLLFGLFILFSALLEETRRLLLWAGLTFVFTIIIEAIGVATGKVFGAYIYGDILGPKIFGVPLLIGFNWTVVILGISSFVFRLLKTRWIAIVLAGLGGVLFDFVMEPVATALGYWTWSGGNIPLQNYVAWFVIGLAAATGYSFTNTRLKTFYPSFYVLLQLAFFGALLLVVR